jgi:acyl carrier protein
MEPASRLAIQERLKQILIADLGVNPGVLADGDATTPLLGQGIGLDSMETLVLVTAIEEEFAVHVEDAELTVELFKNIATLAEYVLRKTTLQHASLPGERAT